MKMQNTRHLKNLQESQNKSGNEKLHEACGVAGFYTDKEYMDTCNPAAEVYKNLIALQHRGQESCGIAVFDGNKITLQVNKKIDDAEKRYGNKFEVVRYYDEAIKVQQKFDVIKSNVISGVLIVLFFMLIFLPGKVGVMATMSMPFCFLVMLGLMPSLGINLHSISMLAMVIALGMLVDNSIVISENFVRLRKEGFTSKEAALESAYQVWLPVTATALTTIFAFLPMLLTKGVIGKFITSIPIIVSLTLAISILEALFLLPTRLVAVSGSVLKKKSANKDRESNTDWFDKVADKFEKLTLYFIRHRYFTLVLFIICIVLSGIFISMNKFILFPAEHVERYQVTYYGKLGDSLEKMNENSIRLANDIMNTLGDDVKYITAFTGRSGNLNLTDTLQQNNHSAEMIVEVTYDASRRLNHYEVLEKLRNMDTSYLEKVSFVTESAGPPSGKAVEVSFRGNEFEDIYKAINAVKEKASKVDGIIDIEYDDYQNDDEIAIKPDYEVLARLGLTSTDVGNTIRASLEGIPITSITLNNREFDIKVRYADEYKQTEEDIKNLKIRDAKGNLIPLYKVAKVERKEGPRMINRYNFKRSITFKANVDETKITAIEANNLIQKFFNEIKDDNPNVNIVFTGEKESTDESFESLAMAMQFALVAIFAILVFMTNSYAKPLLIMTSIPLGLLGFAVAFYLHAKPVSFLAMIGIVGLAGIVVNVGIVLISFIDEMRKHSTMPLEEIPHVQKHIIAQAKKAGRITITATQMLASMVKAQRPTRGETTDVANAVIDGTDALMLSDETANGDYPDVAVATLARIARAAEQHNKHTPDFDSSLFRNTHSFTLAIGRAACWLAKDVGARAIVSYSATGLAPYCISRFRPECELLVLTFEERVCSMMSLIWGAQAVYSEVMTDMDSVVETAKIKAIESGLVEQGDTIIVTAGMPFGKTGTTSLLRLVQI